MFLFSVHSHAELGISDNNKFKKVSVTSFKFFVHFFLISFWFQNSDIVLLRSFRMGFYVILWALMPIIVVNDVDNFLWCTSCAFHSVEVILYMYMYKVKFFSHSSLDTYE